MLSDVDIVVSGQAFDSAADTSGISGGCSASVRLTLRKCDKLKNKVEFDSIKSKGVKYSSPYFTLLVLFGGEFGVSPRCGVICSRRFHKRAVVRNRAKRLLFESFRHLKGSMRPCGIVLIPRRAIQGVTMPLVQSRLEKIAVLFKEDISRK